MAHIIVGETAYEIDTDEQREAAKQALRDAGQESAPVWVGEPGAGEAVKNGEVLFA